METEHQSDAIADRRADYNNPYTFSPVTFTEIAGTIALGLLALILLFALLRSHARYRKLLKKLVQERPTTKEA